MGDPPQSLVYGDHGTTLARCTARQIKPALRSLLG